MLPLCIAFAIALLDQVSKYLICKHFVLHGAMPIIPNLFDLRYIRNTGAAWGIFPGGHLWLALVSSVMLGMIVFFRKSFLSESLIDRIAFGCIVGGIVGNFVDRIRLQYVVDFLDFYWGPHHFPAFNVADSAICIGVALYICSQFIAARSQSAGAGEALT